MPTARKLLIGAMSMALAVVLVKVGVPTLAHASWSVMVAAVRGVSVHALAGLTVLWIVGLWAHTWVLTGALPRLSHRRALTLSLTGSAVSNVLPLGGAAGIALNRHMTYSWGFTPRAFWRYTVLTNLWDVLTKLTLPVIALLLLVATGDMATHSLRVLAYLAAGLLTVTVLLIAVALGSDTSARRLAQVAESTVNGLLRVLRVRRRVALVDGAVALRRECADLIATRWLRLSLGMVAYSLLQWLLLWACLREFGAGLTAAEIFAGFAVERLLTVLPLTPGGAGLVEVGLGGILVAFGGDPLPVFAGVLVYRLFTLVLEVPVGGASLGLWWLGSRLRGVRRAPTALPDVPRVAHVSDCYLPRLGGIETHLRDLVVQQRTAGMNAEVLTPTAAGPLLADAVPDPAWVRRLGGSRLTALREAQRLVAAGRYDVVHAHLSVWSPFAMVMTWTAVRTGVPVVVTVHSLWTRLGPIPRILGYLAGARHWPVVWSAVSAAAAEPVRAALGVPEVLVTPNPLDAQAWEPAARSARPEVTSGAEVEGAGGADDAAVTLVSVGRLARRKRTLALLRMARRLQEELPDHRFELVLVGDGPQQHRVESYVRRHGLQDVVRLAGRVSREEVRAQLVAADVYVAPAELESFGIAALEARCAGLPVVASSQGGVGSFITHGVDGLLGADDEAITAALARLIRDGELRARIRQHNETHATTLTWARTLPEDRRRYQQATRLRNERLPGLAPAGGPLVVPG